MARFDAYDERNVFIPIILSCHIWDNGSCRSPSIVVLILYNHNKDILVKYTLFQEQKELKYYQQ